MAQAKMFRGKPLYYRADGAAVDAENNVIDGAPKQAPDTEPSKQPGAADAKTPAQEMAEAIATALRGSKPASSKATGEDAEDEVELPSIRDLPVQLAKVKSTDAVKAQQAKDERPGARKHYEARLAELEE